MSSKEVGGHGGSCTLHNDDEDNDESVEGFSAGTSPEPLVVTLAHQGTAAAVPVLSRLSLVRSARVIKLATPPQLTLLALLP